MGALNAFGHVLCASAGGDVDELWDLLGDLAGRAGIEERAPGVHVFTPADRALAEERGEVLPRYCLHPTGEPGIEVRDDSLREALIKGLALVAQLIPEHEMWRRD